MHVLILHDEVAADARADERDVLDQVEAVATAVAELGHSCARVAFGVDLGKAQAALSAAAPDVVFNLVESVQRRGRLAHLAPALLEALRVPFTGCGSVASLLTASKLVTKRLLRLAALPTPLAFTLAELRAGVTVPPGRYLTKSVWEHGSLGIEADAVVTADDASTLAAALEQRREALDGEAFAELYVHGREFNLALLETDAGVTCLPAAEIRFRGAADAPRIVGYRAKWAVGSEEDQATPRAFDFPPDDRALLLRLRELAVATWQRFDLAGYARVDVRIDEAGAPWIVDVNANPCISPGAGYPAAVARAGLSFRQAIAHVLTAAMRDRGAPARPSLRGELSVGDEDRVRAIVDSTGFFTTEEVDIAVELVAERRAKGDASGYHFVFLELGAATIGYACYGPIAGTDGSHDLYWIAVDQRVRGRGHGRTLMRAAEAGMAQRGGVRAYIDTSTKPQYLPTRAFYESCGYELVAELPDFYRKADGKAIYGKVLGGSA